MIAKHWLILPEAEFHSLPFKENHTSICIDGLFEWAHQFMYLFFVRPLAIFTINGHLFYSPNQVAGQFILEIISKLIYLKKAYFIKYDIVISVIQFVYFARLIIATLNLNLYEISSLIWIWDRWDFIIYAMQF